MKSRSEITGFKELSYLLKHLQPNVEKRVLQRAVSGAARVGAKEIRSATPRDLDDQSPASKLYGRGYKNIRVQRLRRVKKGQKGARISTGNAFWLYFYELGTRFQPARPFFANAFRRTYEAMLQALSENILDGITKEALKLVKKK